jgi:hypothetical protein
MTQINGDHGHVFHARPVVIIWWYLGRIQHQMALGLVIDFHRSCPHFMACCLSIVVWFSYVQFAFSLLRLSPSLHLHVRLLLIRV